jgi:TM2 domain-containing membrane protein YozV
MGMNLNGQAGYAIAKGIIYGGAGLALLFFIAASIWMLWVHNSIDLNNFGDGFLKVIGGSTGAVLGHNRIMKGESDGVSNQPNAGG